MLLQTKQGRDATLLPLIALKLGVLLLLGQFVWVLVVVFSISNAYLLYKFFKNGLVRPVNTARGLAVVGLSVGFVGLAIILGYTFALVEVLLVLVPVVASVATGLAVKYVELKRKLAAKQKVESSGAKVVAITGSFGKTTTKKFVKDLLERKYKVVATYKNANTPLMIYGTLANSPKPEIYVVEMGAYRKGEIAGLASVAVPDIGVVTAVEPQHMSLFGSLQAIKDAKYEIVAGIKQGGTAVFNISGKNVDSLVARARKERPDLKVLTYAIGPKSRIASYSAKILKNTNQEISFEVTDGNEKKKFTVHLPAEFLIENVLGAICVARELGLTWLQIASGVGKLSTYDQIMTVHELANGLTIIDDSKNSPPSGFYAALDKLATYTKPKIVVTTGTIELGMESHKFHREIATRMAKLGVEQVVLTNDEFAADFTKGFVGSKVKFEVAAGRSGLAKLRAIPKANSAILLEGRLPAHIRSIFL